MRFDRPASGGVGDILRLYGSIYREETKLSTWHLKNMYAIENCRTSGMGSHADKCDKCGHILVSYNSCRNRHCPQCQGLNKIKWVDKLSCDLLPVRYFHVVFTIPTELNRLALVNQKSVYDILFKAASESLMMLAQDKKHLGVQTGMVAILHTWGQNLMDHPHLHVLVPAGGWNEIAQSWMYSRKKFFISCNVISEVFRGKFLSFLKEACKRNQLKFEGGINTLNQKKNFKRFLSRLYQKEWVVYCNKSFKDSQRVVRYLGHYSHRVAIDNHRIVGIKDGNVTFLWKDYKDHDKKKLMTLPAKEFIRRFLLHILPGGFFKIRYYGIFAARNRKTILAQCRNALNTIARKSRFTGLTWQEMIFLITGKNPMICPVCKKGIMVQYSVIKGRRAPPIKNK